MFFLIYKGNLFILVCVVVKCIIFMYGVIGKFKVCLCMYVCVILFNFFFKYIFRFLYGFFDVVVGL